MQLETGRAIARRIAEAIGNCPGVRAANPRRVQIVGAIKNRAFGLNEQFREDLLDRGEVLVIVEVLFFDIENERVLRMEKLQRAVALVAFRDEIFAARIPVRVAAENRNFRADVMRRMQAAFAQNVRRHRGRRRLAVHPRDDDPALAEHDRGERFGAADGGNFAGPRVRQDRVVFLDRRRKNNQLGAFSVFRPMRRREAKSELREPLRLERARFVGAAHVVPEFEEKRSDSTHSAAGDADQMDRVPFLGEEFWEIEVRRRRRHVADRISPSFRRPNWPRFSARALRRWPTSCEGRRGRSVNRGFFGRAIRPRARIPSKAQRPSP